MTSAVGTECCVSGVCDEHNRRNDVRRLAYLVRRVAEDLGVHVHCAPGYQGPDVFGGDDLSVRGIVQDGDAGLCIMPTLDRRGVMLSWTSPEHSYVIPARHADLAVQMRRLFLDVTATALRGLDFTLQRTGYAWLVTGSDR